MTVRTRFAPSPTGHLHLGNIRTALLSWLYAKKSGGSMLLRLDDTDLERNVGGMDQAIIDSLGWLGLDWDEVIRQSDRRPIYLLAFEQLRESNKVYPCAMTQEQTRALAAERKLAGKSTALHRRELESDLTQGVHWRFEMPRNKIAWKDMLQGQRAFLHDHLTDPVIIRSDDSPTYLFSNAVDDAECDITHVIRGEDHVSNTPVQIALTQAMGKAPPVFMHLPLVFGRDGKLSKREGALSLVDIQQMGIEPEVVAAVLEALGTSHGPHNVDHAAELAELFDPENYGRASPKITDDDLKRVNAQRLRSWSLATWRSRLESSPAPLPVSDAFIEDIAPNCDIADDLRIWHALCQPGLTFETDDPVPVEAFAKHLTAELAKDEATFKTAMKVISAETGRKGRKLFMPIRKALTGLEHGPEMHLLLRHIGLEQVQARCLAAIRSSCN